MALVNPGLAHFAMEGTLKLKDELRCAYFILGRRQDEELRN